VAIGVEAELAGTGQAAHVLEVEELREFAG
jgi:hypothetical protein